MFKVVSTALPSGSCSTMLSRLASSYGGHTPHPAAAAVPDPSAPPASLMQRDEDGASLLYATQHSHQGFDKARLWRALG